MLNSGAIMKSDTKAHCIVFSVRGIEYFIVIYLLALFVIWDVLVADSDLRLKKEDLCENS